MLLERCGPCVPEKAGTAEGEKPLEMPRAGTSPIRGTTTASVAQGLQLQSLDQDTMDDPSTALFPPWGKDAWLQNSLHLLLARAAALLTILNGFSKDSIMFWAFFCATVNGVFPFSSALGSCKDKPNPITSNHYVVPSGHLPGTTTGRISFLN